MDRRRRRRLCPGGHRSPGNALLIASFGDTVVTLWQRRSTAAVLFAVHRVEHQHRNSGGGCPWPSTPSAMTGWGGIRTSIGFLQPFALVAAGSSEETAAPQLAERRAATRGSTVVALLTRSGTEPRRPKRRTRPGTGCRGVSGSHWIALQESEFQRSQLAIPEGHRGIGPRPGSPRPGLVGTSPTRGMARSSDESIRPPRKWVSDSCRLPRSRPVPATGWRRSSRRSPAGGSDISPAAAPFGDQDRR